MDYDIVAKYKGDTVKFCVKAGDIKDALRQGREGAKKVFDWDKGEEPTVAVKTSRKQEDNE